MKLPAIIEYKLIQQEKKRRAEALETQFSEDLKKLSDKKLDELLKTYEPSKNGIDNH